MTLGFPLLLLLVVAHAVLGHFVYPLPEGERTEALVNGIVTGGLLILTWGLIAAIEVQVCMSGKPCRIASAVAV